VYYRNVDDQHSETLAPMYSDGVDGEFGGFGVEDPRPIRVVLIELANHFVSWQRSFLDDITVRDSSRHRHLASVSLHSLPCGSPIFLSPICCRQRDLQPQGPCEVCACHPETASYTQANIGDSQTRHSFHAIPRWKRSLYILHILEPCHTGANAEGWNRYWQPRNATSHEVGATRSAIAEPGGKEGSCAICPVCELVPGLSWSRLSYRRL
jgi:hypothetical protein